VKFLVDAQLPPALASWLREAGHEAAHVETIGLRDADDRSIWDHAARAGVTIVTKDEDFAARAAHAVDADRPVIVWLRVGNTTNAALQAWLERRLPDILEILKQGHRLVEVI
jgi:predicted nuclease of predicted toxin-antitoxin system